MKSFHPTPMNRPPPKPIPLENLGVVSVRRMLFINPALTLGMVRIRVIKPFCPDIKAIDPINDPRNFRAEGVQQLVSHVSELALQKGNVIRAPRCFTRAQLSFSASITGDWSCVWSPGMKS